MFLATWLGAFQHQHLSIPKFSKKLQSPDQLPGLSSTIFDDKFLAVRLGGVLRSEVDHLSPPVHISRHSTDRGKNMDKNMGTNREE